VNKICWTTLIFTLLLINARASEKGDQYSELLGIKLEQSKLSEVVNSLGVTKLFKSGDASESSKRLNYYFPNEKTYVTFDVCEMGGDSTITLFHLSNKAPMEEFRNVPGTKFSMRDIGKLRIGMGKKEFCKNLALARSCEGDSIAEYFLDSIPMTQKEMEKINLPSDQRAMWDIGIGVMGKFRENKLSDLYLSKTVTN
jgi:hypothetical protein